MAGPVPVDAPEPRLAKTAIKKNRDTTKLSLNVTIWITPCQAAEKAAEASLIRVDSLIDW